MDTKQINKIRHLVIQAKQASSQSGRVRYPKSLKEQVISILRSGQTPTEVSHLTGIQVSTLFKWSRVSVEAADDSKFRQVDVVSRSRSKVFENGSSEITITLPSGLRVEGPATVATLRKLLEWLK